MEGAVRSPLWPGSSAPPAAGAARSPAAGGAVRGSPPTRVKTAPPVAATIPGSRLRSRVLRLIASATTSMWSSRERSAFGLFWSSSSAGRLGRGHRQRHGTALPLGWPSRERSPSTARQGTARRCRCPMWSMHERTSRRWPGPPGVTLQVTSGGSRRPVPGLGVVADVDLHRQVRCVRVPRHVQAVTAGARDPPASAGCWSTHTALDRPACHPARRCTSAAPRCGSGRRGRGNPALEHAAGARHLHDRNAVSVRLIVWREAFLVDDEIVDGPLIGFSDPIRLLRDFSHDSRSMVRGWCAGRSSVVLARVCRCRPLAAQVGA